MPFLFPDPLIDPNGENLGKLLAAAIPVCGGISLEYYFSFVDNEGYGCGTKLPHNITGLVGIMNGHASDLRTGLPWQMVEIHEPVRILFNIEADPEVLMRVIRASPQLAEFVENRWIRLSSMHPQTGEIRVYRDGHFEPNAPWAAPLPEAKTSGDWYRGTRAHLPIARITNSPMPDRVTA
ncbi:MAG: putative inorganic carbon transporter subunit DabA [Bryobacteraceae bacterium]